MIDEAIALGLIAELKDCLAAVKKFAKTEAQTRSIEVKTGHGFPPGTLWFYCAPSL